MDQNDGLLTALTKGSAGKAVLFCGAGASIDCVNFDLTELPSANPLLGKFNSYLGKSFVRLPIAASNVADNSLADYYKIITDSFKVNKVSQDLKTILTYPWARIYTTNYDDAIEKACQEIDRKAQTLTHLDTPRNIQKGTLPIVHLHGYINHFRIDTIRNDCILDYNSNVANTVYSGPWGTELKNDISTADVVVFMGYSLYDPEIAKIILQGGVSKRKIFFINSKVEDPELRYMQESFGRPLAIEKDGLSTIISSIPVPKGPLDRRYVCFKRSRDTSVEHRVVTHQDVNDLFIFGKVRDELLQSDIANSTSNYIVPVHEINTVRDALQRGKTLISLYSPLGHGKSLISKLLAAELGKERDVFLAIRNQDEFLEEIRQIVSSHQQPIIIFDDYYKFIRHQVDLAKFKSEEVIFIFTSRLNVYEVRKEELPSIYLNHEIFDVRVGALSQVDAEKLVPLINQAGMWGELSHLSDLEKTRKLVTKGDNGFQGNFADILVGLMNSHEMIGRIRKELTVLKEVAPDAYRVVLLSLYLEFTNNHIDEFIIDQALEVDLAPLHSRNDVGNIFRIFFSPESSSSSYFNGSIFAKYAMEHICEHDDLLDVIEEASGRLAGIRYISNEAKAVLIDLLRFNYLKVIASGKTSRFEKIRSLYSNLSANPNLNKDDLFWNAFGMCERQLENFDEAIRHFRTGISYSKNRNEKYISYHAQNQLIICLLERAEVHSIDSKVAYENAVEIADLLMVQADDERQHGRGQAFKWHEQLKAFFVKYYDGFSDAEKARVHMKYGRYIAFIKNSVVNWQAREHAALMVGKVEGFLRSHSLG